MGWRAVPALWRILARNAHDLRSTWRKEQAVMRRGLWPPATSGARRSGWPCPCARYMIEYHAAILGQAGDGDAALLKILGVVDHYATLNTLSEGMQIESDIVPPS